MMASWGRIRGHLESTRVLSKIFERIYREYNNNGDTSKTKRNY